jgi:uncharacterized membrane protein
MIRSLAAYLAAALVFGLIDAAWLTLMGPKLYRPLVGPILADKIALAPAAIFYLLYIAGVVVLAVLPALKEASWSRAAWSGAVLGLVAYGTYDLTNQATLKVWATRITVLDMAYGAIATALAAICAYQAASWAGRAFSR